MSNKPTSQKLTFLELISKHIIEIPIIQRDYAQGRKGKSDIRTNFLNALLEVVNGKKLVLDFVYGSVNNNILQPLDGQQRLTTLFLLHWFIAIKEKKLDNELKNLLSKFTYEIRTSSKEFCIDLINKGIVYNCEHKISELLIDSPWFFLSWNRDPTIQSMLTMLDAIQQTFQEKAAVWEMLNNISFHYVELNNFGLSDDLYIKMNARGKALTNFENFKAKFEQHIQQNKWENNEKSLETFSHLIDTVWADLFWKHRNDQNIFDEELLNFFRTMAVINYTLKANTKEDTFRKNLDLLRGSQPVSFIKYLELDCFDNEYFITLKSVLNKLSEKNGLKKYLSDTTYVNEEGIFNGAINNDLPYPDLVITFSYYQYLASEKNIETENLKSWLRVVRNLVEGSRPYLFNNASEFANALCSIRELLPHRNSILKHFAESESNLLSGFISEQVNEEKLKAKLIMQNDDWKYTIIEIENHKYFNGQIGFILDWCKDENGLHNIEKFKKYTKKSKAVFNDGGLNNFDNYLFERALLATGDYLLSKGKNYSFLVNKERDISWKRLLRDDNKNREILKQLIDKISVVTIYEDLQAIIQDFSNTEDWRYHFIKQAEMIAACGSQKLARFNDNNEFDILLLGSSATSHYHKEYYSYSLFVELTRTLSLDDRLYKDQRSIDYRKYFELNGQQISFDCNTGKYIWTTNNEWDKSQEFGNRDEAILKLTKI
jgi:hypothetical protein